MRDMTSTMWDETHRRRVVRLCAALTGDRDGAEDLAQETLLEAWRNAHKLTDPRGADRWLAAVARNVCLRARHRPEVPVAEPPELAVEDRRVDLPAALPEVLVLRYLHDLSLREIAAELGISEDAVSMRLARAKQALREQLSAAEWHRTQRWCIGCGAHRLLMRREDDAVAFRCPGCDGPSGRSAVFPLGNPVLGGLIAGLERPSAMFGRIGAWSLSYYADGAGAAVACTRCGGPTVLRALRRDSGRGLWGRCGGCGEEVWSSLVGLASALPEVRALRRRAPRAAAGERVDGEAVVVRVALGPDRLEV